MIRVPQRLKDWRRLDWSVPAQSFAHKRRFLYTFDLMMPLRAGDRTCRAGKS
jgi:hypothetical protein